MRLEDLGWDGPLCHLFDLVVGSLARLNGPGGFPVGRVESRADCFVRSGFQVAYAVHPSLGFCPDAWDGISACLATSLPHELGGDGPRVGCIALDSGTLA